jgi:hypothetical protein
MWPWNGTTNPFGQLPWTVTPEQVRPADMLDHRPIAFYDTVDPECRRRLPKVRKENIKDLIKENSKEVLRKEDLKEFVREKGFSPKENKDIREVPQKRFPEIPDPKGIREGFDPREPFIPREIRPDLTDAALNLEPDIADLRAELARREGGFGGGGFGGGFG